jgi:hypothetical protein
MATSVENDLSVITELERTLDKVLVAIPGTGEALALSNKLGSPHPHPSPSRQLFQARRLCVKSNGICSSTADARRIGCLEQRVNADCAGEPLRRSCAGGLRAVSLDIHDSLFRWMVA